MKAFCLSLASNRSLLVLTAALTVGASAAPSALALSLSLTPPSISASVGDPVDVAIRITGLGDGTAPSLGAFDLNLHFNPARLGLSAVAFGDPVHGDALDLGTGTSAGQGGDPGAGVLNLYSVSLASISDLETLQPGDFTLATVRFTALTAGLDTLTLTDVLLGDAYGDALTPDTQTSASVRITAPSSVPDSDLPMVSMLLATTALLVSRRRWVGVQETAV